MSDEDYPLYRPGPNRVCETLKMLKPHIFELKAAIEIQVISLNLSFVMNVNITIVDGLGAKIQSSSELVKKMGK